MIKKALIFSISFIVLLLMVFGYVFFIYNDSFVGNPDLTEESKEIVTEYLQTIYPEQNFTVDQTYYYDGNYNVHFRTNDGNIQGEISVRNSRIYVVNFYDENGLEILNIDK